MNTTPDTLTLALDQTESLIGRIGPDDLHRPTGCADFDVAALTGHLLAVVDRLRIILTTGTFEGSPVEWDTDGIDLVAEFQRLRAGLAPVLSTTTPDAPVTMPWGPSVAAAAIAAYAGEFTVHDWDLAVALVPPAEVTSVLEDDLAVAALEGYRRMLPPGARPAEVPFEDEVEVPQDASPYHRLVAFTGRNPFTSHPS